jgi:eukaryotic-like serine/threonine-protein kinase
MPLGPGTRLGPYEVVAAIGAGGMGEVYRARDTKLDRDVALKIYATGNTSSTAINQPGSAGSASACSPRR